MTHIYIFRVFAEEARGGYLSGSREMPSITFTSSVKLGLGELRKIAKVYMDLLRYRLPTVTWNDQTVYLWTQD